MQTPTFVALDFETADYGRDSACAIGIVKVQGAQIIHEENRLIRPPRQTVYSGESGHLFRFKPATDRSEATLDGHYTSLWPE
jgi:DNA polymerase III epsilon subunit-like protein